MEFPMQSDRASIPARAGSGTHLNANIFPLLTFRKQGIPASCGSAAAQCMMMLNRRFPVPKSTGTDRSEPEKK
jgi:hypothetical protein